jgi:thiol-disulfide isomerase/thioredoxin
MARLLLAVWTCIAGSAFAAEFPVAPAIHGDVWINSSPLTAAQLRGKVVLLEFWTFGCWNCRNVEPYVKQWHADYADRGLLVLAVHSPEFHHEARLENVQRHVRDNDLRYPVAVDNGFVTWKRFGNRAWPALYLIDKAGRIRYRHVGEGRYAATEKAIQSLLAESAPQVRSIGSPDQW